MERRRTGRDAPVLAALSPVEGSSAQLVREDAARVLRPDLHRSGGRLRSVRRRKRRPSVAGADDVVSCAARAGGGRRRGGADADLLHGTRHQDVRRDRCWRLSTLSHRRRTPRSGSTPASLRVPRRSVVPGGYRVLRSVGGRVILRGDLPEQHDRAVPAEDRYLRRGPDLRGVRGALPHADLGSLRRLGRRNGGARTTVSDESALRSCSRGARC
jgi:hypothetical protein